MGQHLRQAGIEPELVLCSSATRTCQTLELLALKGTAEVLIEDELYGATAIELLERLRQVSGDAASVLVIGHNPGIEELTLLLVGDDSGLGEKFPTAALAEVQLLIEGWPELGPGSGRLQSFVVPRELE
jgi:phosphohistidine phosphatase